MSYAEYFECQKGYEGLQYLESIKNDIVSFYEALNLDFDFQKKLIIGGADTPRYCIGAKNNLPYDLILLTLTDFGVWDQTIYQLSHEITHCFIHCHNSNENVYASWLEETICEAMSLYFLSYFYETWKTNALCTINFMYDMYIKKYLQDILNKKGNNRLSLCNGYAELMEIDRTSQEQRDDRKNEMVGLYANIIKRDIKGLIQYRDYIYPNEKILNCEKYLQDYPFNRAVKYLCNLQNSILARDEKYRKQA